MLQVGGIPFKSAVREDPITGAELCIPTLFTYIVDYAQDSELLQNLLDVLSILVKESFYKGNEAIVGKNVESLFANADTLRVLFGQFSNEDMYSRLVVIDILKWSLKVNRVDFTLDSNDSETRGRLYQSRPASSSTARRLSERQPRGNSE